MYSSAHGGPPLSTACRARLQVALEFAPVVELGQRVVARLVGQQLRQLALFRNIGGHHQQLVAQAQVHLRNRGRGPEAISRQRLQHRVDAVPAGRPHRLAQPLLQCLVFEQRAQRLAGDALAQARQRSLVGVDDLPVVGVRHQHQRWQQVVERAETFFAFAVASTHLPAEVTARRALRHRPQQRCEHTLASSPPSPTPHNRLVS